LKIIYGDLFDQVADCIAITTNGYVKSNHENVMGRGIAAEVAKRWPSIKHTLGAAIHAEGNRVHRLTIRFKETPTGRWRYALLDGLTDNLIHWDIVSFPVKPDLVISNGKNVVRHMVNRFPFGAKVPGWAARANIKLIAQSCEELVVLADRVGWKTIVIPRPGCGAGELDWEEVSPVLEAAFDDRFSVITLP